MCFRPADAHPLTAELEAASRAMAARAAVGAMWFETNAGEAVLPPPGA